jgi:hypothetical protein
VYLEVLREEEKMNQFLVSPSLKLTSTVVRDWDKSLVMQSVWAAQTESVKQVRSQTGSLRGLCSICM